MTTYATILFLFFAMSTTTSFCLQEMEVLQMAKTQVSQAINWVDNSMKLHGLESMSISLNQTSVLALRDCAKLYEESEFMLNNMMVEKSSYTKEDAIIWVSAMMTNHKTCLDGLEEKGYVQANQVLDRNLTSLLGQTLVLYSNNKIKVKEQPQRSTILEENDGLLDSWSLANHRADFTVAQDGSGSHRTIKEAVDALASMGHNRPSRAVIHVKAGVYHEKVEIEKKLHNVMFVGDGIDKTIVTGNRNVVHGSTTLNSASFDVSGDGFWARDMTFENTAGPENHQAVALKVSSDLSVFYRCSFKAYQDTLYVHSNRQFYRDCHIYGTIDFIFGDAAVVLQNCDIFIRKPMSHQSNFITAQGRDDPNKPTGISIQNCRVRPDSDFSMVKDSIKSFLGRPWKKYSRTVFIKSDLDGLIHPKGWGEWEGNFALSTLYYGEYMNTGNGASTQNRVNWPGFHVLKSSDEASQFTVSRFLQGEHWISASGVPVWSGI
ncbi:putative pectinesterase [Medicago truncatula]|uniref:Pectinesterase n=1 Tax=Medicago truncatula TaxID=3880 RepID=A0A072UTA3_MEDTR|nr:probable pectinesterase/pectinesterase inhibitor 36 [Medicago truncatula]KEH29120.1 pectinesterase/pectinesterase inhibitor [Medicago truncatula]RHN59302.1 putative pectinesterase [Medicago truncatula]